jgi:hypothetical protein
MASERAIALIRANAVGRLEKAVSTLSKSLDGVKELAPLSTIRGLGDIELAHARQLEALADVLDSVVKTVEGSGKTGEKEEKGQVTSPTQDKQVKNLEFELADAQTQLLEAHKGEKAAPADTVKPASNHAPKGK